MPIACGFAADHPGQTHHDTAAQVVMCSRRHYATKVEREIEAARDAETRADAEAEQAAELAYERHLEDRGYHEARAQEDWEARQGVVPFDEAYAAALAQPEPAPQPRGRYRDLQSPRSQRHLRRELSLRERVATIPVHEQHGTGHYAVRNGEAVELYQVERPTEGEHAGATFVRPYGERTNLRGEERRRVFEAILADVLGAAALFGQKTGKCGICHHKLRKEESLERVAIVDGREVTGVGPKCAKKFRRPAA